MTTTLSGDPTVNLSDTSGGAFAEAGGTDTVTATLSAATTVPITVDLNFSGSAGEGSELSASANSITIAAGQTSGSITLTGIDTSDTSDEGITVAIVSVDSPALIGGSPSMMTTLSGDAANDIG